MKIQDQIGPRRGRPRHCLRLDPRRGAWFPEEAVAVGVEALRLDRHVHSSESDFGVLLIAAARPSGPIYQDVRVVEDFFVAWQKLHGFDVSRLRDREWDDEIAKEIGRSGGQR